MILYTNYLDLGAKLSPTSVYTGPSHFQLRRRQGMTPYDQAKRFGHREVMGVLDPVPWRWDEHPLVDQGFGTRGL